MILEMSLYIMGLAMLMLAFVSYRIDLRQQRKTEAAQPAQISFPLVFFGAISLMLGVVMSGATHAPY